MRDYVLFVVIGVALMLAIARPLMGLGVWAWLSYMSPHRLAYGFAHNASVVQPAAGITIIGAINFFSAKMTTGDRLAGLVVKREVGHRFADFAVRVFASGHGVFAQTAGRGCHRGGGNAVIRPDFFQAEITLYARNHLGADALAGFSGSKVSGADQKLHRHRGHVAFDLIVLDDQHLARDIDARDFAGQRVASGDGLGGSGWSHRGDGRSRLATGAEGEQQRGAAQPAAQPVISVHITTDSSRHNFVKGFAASSSVVSVPPTFS